MKIIQDCDFEKELKLISSEYGYNLDDEIISNLKKYKELLIEWNEKMNLTNITENYDVIIKHFIDCLECTKYINENDKVIDVGTGAGFPGMVIAIFFKDKLDITLLDSLNKRLVFLEEVKNKLNFKNIKIIHERAEEGAHKDIYREKYDIVVSRAVASLNNLLEYTIAYINKDGKCLYMKGDNYLEEINNSEKAFKILDCKLKNRYEYILKADKEEYNRIILEITKNKETNIKYPRNYGKMKKNPL